MLSFCLTLPADAYPLICPVASSPHCKGNQYQPLEPGCWFSRTIGLSAASGELTGAVAAAGNRHSRAVTTIRLDRKSTRLNSSHGYISYAVFCLKKKKKNRCQSHTTPYRWVSTH